MDEMRAHQRVSRRDAAGEVELLQERPAVPRLGDELLRSAEEEGGEL